ncbi:MAG: glucosamine-6-phosphate deaminase [Ferruginibacter sp.]
MHKKIFSSGNDMAAAAADAIIDLVKDMPDALLCFATGNTPVETYRLLVKKALAEEVDFSRCFCIGLDEWVGVEPGTPGSCHYTLHEQLFRPLGITASQLHLFDAMAEDPDMECKKMDILVAEKGGIDCMLVGVGLNGHVGFNEPGVDIKLGAHVQLLHPSTLESGKHYFETPVAIQKGITLGLTHMMHARLLLMLANGSHKATVVKRLAEEEVTNMLPAGYIRKHANGWLLLDEAAASLLEAQVLAMEK